MLARVGSICLLAGCAQIVGISDYNTVDAGAAACVPKQASYPAGMSPHALAIADVNGDGKLDLIVVDGATNSIGLLLGNGDGTFMALEVGPTAALDNPVAIAAADLNGDGKTDVVVANFAGDDVTVLLGMATPPFFGSPANYAGPSQANAVALANFDASEGPDIAVTGFQTGQLSILKNNGDGTFAPKVDVTTSPGPTGVAAADFNGDGKIDLVVSAGAGTSPLANSVTPFPNNGTGTFSVASTYFTNTNPNALVALDVDGDAKADVITADHDSNSVSFLAGLGSAAFKPRADSPTGKAPVALAAADLDGDHKIDVVTANFGANSVSVLYGNGDGTFKTNIDYPVGMGAIAVAIADFDGDMKPDLAVANELDATVTVIRLGTCP